MNDAQKTAEAVETESPFAEPAVDAMTVASTEIYVALAKAWPTFVSDYQNGGPEPLITLATVLCRQQWIITEAWIAKQGKTAPEELFFAVASSCLGNLAQGLQSYGNAVSMASKETVQ